MNLQRRRVLRELQHVVESGSRIEPERRGRRAGSAAGMRSWICASFAFAAVVTITQVSSLSPLGASPPLPQAREREQRLARGANEMRALAAVFGLAPLVEAARGNQAAAPGPALRETPACCDDAVEARVDEPAADRHVLGPEGHEAPVQRIERRRPSCSRTTATAWPGVRL